MADDMSARLLAAVHKLEEIAQSPSDPFLDAAFREEATRVLAPFFHVELDAATGEWGTRMDVEFQKAYEQQVIYPELLKTFSSKVKH